MHFGYTRMGQFEASRPCLKSAIGFSSRGVSLRYSCGEGWGWRSTARVTPACRFRPLGSLEGGEAGDGRAAGYHRALDTAIKPIKHSET
jgi:hypothetical protein